MKVNHYYTERFVNRYKLDVSLWKAFMNFFGLYPNIYDDAVKSIAKKTTREALISDVTAIRDDSYKVIAEHELRDVNQAQLTYAEQE